MKQITDRKTKRIIESSETIIQDTKNIESSLKYLRHLCNNIKNENVIEILSDCIQEVRNINYNAAIVLLSMDYKFWKDLENVEDLEDEE